MIQNRRKSFKNTNKSSNKLQRTIFNQIHQEKMVKQFRIILIK